MPTREPRLLAPPAAPLYRYTAYGVVVASTVTLPELRPATHACAPEAVLHLLPSIVAERHRRSHGDVLYQRDAESGSPFPSHALRRTRGGLSWRFPGLGGFLIPDRGRTVTVWRERADAWTDLRSIFLGPVLSLVLQRRGHVHLHASAVLIDGEALLFLGHPGQGKSTLTASLTAAGAQLLADDIVPVRVGEGRVVASPGCSRLKLWRDTLEQLGIEPEQHPRTLRSVDKRVLLAGRTFGRAATAPAAIRALYLLETDSSEHGRVSLERSRGLGAVMQIVPHTYNGHLLPAEVLAEQLGTLAALEQLAPIWRLRYPRGFEWLPAVHRALCAGRESAGR